MKKIPVAAVYFLTLLTAAVIITASLIPHLPKFMHPFSFSDKIFHTLAYMVFSILFFLSLKTGMRDFKHTGLLTLFLVLFVGGLIELIQPLFGRSKDIYDFLSDFTGSSAGILLTKYFIRRLKISFTRKGIFFGIKHF